MLSWTNLNPTVKELDTKKKFFGVYLYKAVGYAPGCRSITSYRRNTGDSLRHLIDRRIQILKSNYHYGWRQVWTAHGVKELEENTRIDQLEYYVDIKEKYPQDIKIRIEEPNIIIYSNDINLLHTIASGTYPDRLKEIHTPKNAVAQSLLEDGHIITNKAKEFTHKITLREHVYKDISVKHSISDYFYNLGDNIQVPKGLTKQLSNNFNYCSGGYIYCNDEKIVTFIQLICPNLVSGIYKLSEPIQ